VRQYRDEIAMVCHEMMMDGYRIGAVSDAEMREFEKNCLVTVPDQPVKKRPPAGGFSRPSRLSASASR